MIDNKPAFGHARTGKVVPARQIGTTDAGNPGFEPDIEGPVDPADWVPGVLRADGRFHPIDESRMPLSGEWVVSLDTLY